MTDSCARVPGPRRWEGKVQHRMRSVSPTKKPIEYRIIYLTEAAEIIDTMYTETMSRRLGSISQANIRAIDPAYATVSYFLLESEERANAYTRVTLICVGLKLYTSLADLPL
jgi:hypothetical protein